MARTKFVNPLFRRTEAPGLEPAPPPEESPAEDVIGPAADFGSDASPVARGSVPESTPNQGSMAGSGPGAAAQETTRQAGQDVPSVGGTRHRSPEAGTEAEAPVKFTFYFSPEQLRQLDNLWVRAKLDHNVKVNKSEFVRLALDRLLREFERAPREVLDDLRRLRP